MTQRRRFGYYFWFYWEKFGILVILLVALVVFAILTPQILNISNLLTVLSRSSIVGIAACGMTFAICAGGFDLSVGAILSLSTCVFATVLPSLGIIPATLITLAVGAVCGLLNGLVITKLKIQTFVATLAMGLIIKGGALVYTQGKKALLNRTANPEAKIFSQNVDVFGYPVQLNALMMMVIVFVIGYFVYRYTRYGVHVRSIGSNEGASRTSGVRVDRTLIIVFMVTGLTAALSSFIKVSQNLQGSATAGDGFELEVITATILGGTSLAGGKGNLWGSFVGAILLALIRNGLNLLGLSDEYQRLVIGLILLLALTISGIQEIMKEAKA